MYEFYLDNCMVSLTGDGAHVFFFQEECDLRDVSMTGVHSFVFFFSSRRRHTRCSRDWSSDVCSSDLLGLAEPFLWRGVAWVGEVMGAAYPEIVRERDRIIEVVRQEEEQFARTLDQGMRRIEEYAQAQGAGRGRPIDGRFLFTLYDTYGFPRDLAEEILVDQGWRVSDETEATWTQEMEAQRERARAKAAFGGDEEATEAVALYQRIGGSLPRPQPFLGYETLTAPAKNLAIVADGRRVREAASGGEIEGNLDPPPGYGEAGGQIGDPRTLRGR